MKPGRLSLCLLALGLALLIVPPVRDGIGMAVQGTHGGGVLDQSESVLRRAINARPDDAQVWLGVAEARASRLRLEGAAGPSSSPTDPQSVVQAYEKAVELQPGSPAARLRLAAFHLAKAWDLGQLDAGVSLTPPPPRSPDQKRSLGSALALLEQARAAEPDNAACDYWLAWCLFAARRDEEAHNALRSALGKDQWSLHDREASTAVCRVAELAGVPQGLRGIWASLAAGDFASSAGLRQIARVLAAEGDDFRSRGEHEQAIMSYLGIAHLGSLVRRNAFSMIEGLVGIGVSHIASGSFGERREGDDRDRVVQARIEGFVAYLRAHGHAADADGYVADMQAAATWKADAHEVTDAMMPYMMHGLVRAGAPNVAALVVAFAGIVGLAFLVGVISLCLRWWREPRQEPAFGYGGWALLLLLATAPGQIVAFIGPRLSASDPMLVAAVMAVVAVSAASALAWAVVAGVISARRRQPARPAFRAALAGLRQLMLPTLIALMVVALLLAPLVHHGLVQMDRDEMRMAEQGEVRYWGIGTGHIAPGATGTAGDR